MSATMKAVIHLRHKNKPEGKWNSTADVMIANFEESGHPVLRASSALDRKDLKKGRWALYDSLQCGSFECRAFISHDHFC